MASGPTGGRARRGGGERGNMMTERPTTDDGPCEYFDCTDPARFTFGVRPSRSIFPNRPTLRLCGDHAVYLRRLCDDEDGPGQWTFLHECGLGG